VDAAVAAAAAAAAERGNRDAHVRGRAATAVSVLHQLSRAGRFDMARDMLGAADRVAVGRVLQARRAQLDVDGRDGGDDEGALLQLDAVARAFDVDPPR
jgi:hypothetical protein